MLGGQTGPAASAVLGTPIESARQKAASRSRLLFTVEISEVGIACRLIVLLRMELCTKFLISFVV
jgi:hypothetical protein